MQNTINARKIFEEALVALRIDMDEAQKEQFYKKYIRNILFEIDELGKVSLECKGK